MSKHNNQFTRGWSQEEIKLLKQYRPHCTLAEMEQIFNQAGFERTAKAISRKAHKLGVFCGSFSYEPKDSIDDVATGLASTPEEARDTSVEQQATWNKILELKEDYETEFEHNVLGAVDNAARKILAISDLHIPFDREDLVLEVVQAHDDADILVINGDLLDLYAVSTWPKERTVVLEKEYQIAMEYMDYFAETFPLVVLTRGNHEYRLNRYFHSNVSPMLSFMVDKEVLSRLSNGEEYNEFGQIEWQHEFNNVVYQSGPEAWFAKIGKTIFAHPMTLSKVPGRIAIQAMEHFQEREDIDCVVVGHSHQVSCIPRRGKLCIEQGCLCAPMDYAKKGTLHYGPQGLGYAVIYQDEDGNCDFTASRPYFLGVQYPIKLSVDEILERTHD